MIKKLLLTLGISLFNLTMAHAQQQSVVVSSCGQQNLSVGARGTTYMDTTGNLCSSGGGGSSGPVKGSGAYSGATIGVTDSTILAASTATVFLDLVSDSPTATICINFGSAATITGTTCAAGEYTIPPLWHRSWEGSFIPTDAIHAIASAASTPATVGVK